MDYDDFKLSIDDYNGKVIIKNKESNVYSTGKPSGIKMGKVSPAAKAPGESKQLFGLGRLERDDLVKGILLSEILGKPVSKRRDRFKNWI